MIPRDFLDLAAGLLAEPTPGTRRCWQRGSACLVRIALEQSLQEYWNRVAPSIAGCVMRHQLLALPAFAGAPRANVARSAWYGLSRAMHHHTYELAPTAGELLDWHHAVDRLIVELEETARDEQPAFRRF